MSDFKVELVIVGKVEKHPNADTLSVTEVFGVPCIFKTGAFKEGDLAIYVPVDAVVPLSDPRFAFLKDKEGQTHARVRSVRLRGLYSEGLLVAKHPTEETFKDDLTAKMGITKYETPTKENDLVAMKGIKAQKPPVSTPTYGVNHFLREQAWALVPGEQVIVTEKIHGCNARYVYSKGKLHVGSHTVWRKDPRPEPTLWERFKGLFGWKRPGPALAKQDPWWKVAKDYSMKERLKDSPGMVVYGEIYGHVQDLTYSVPPKQVVEFAAFDVYDSNKGRWLTHSECVKFCLERKIPMVPYLWDGPYDVEAVKKLASGVSKIDGRTMREGVVVRRVDGHLKPREVLKLVSEEYKLRKEGTEYH